MRLWTPKHPLEQTVLVGIYQNARLLRYITFRYIPVINQSDCSVCHNYDPCICSLVKYPMKLLKIREAILRIIHDMAWCRDYYSPLLGQAAEWRENCTVQVHQNDH